MDRSSGSTRNGIAAHFIARITVKNVREFEGAFEGAFTACRVYVADRGGTGMRPGGRVRVIGVEHRRG